MTKGSSTCIIHILIAIACLPLQIVLGETFKLLLAPYVFYLTWTRNPLYLPALFILITPGTTVSYVILLTSFLITILNIPKFKSLGLGKVLICILLPIPLFIYMTGERILDKGISIANILTPLGYYLGLFPFFFGILVAKNINKTVIEGVLFSLLILPFLKFLPGIDFSVRAYWLSFPLFVSMIGAKIILGKRWKIPLRWIILSGIFTVLSFGGVLGLKFTLLFAGVVSTVGAIASVKGYKGLLNFLAKPRLIILSIALVIGLIAGSAKYGDVLYRSNFGKEDLDYSFQSWDEFWTMVQYKAFDDRAVIWAGGWNTIKDNNLIWPPYDPPKLAYTTATGIEIEDISFGVHNIGLELMRNYGVVVGGLTVLVYLWMLIIGPGKYLLRNRQNSYLIVLASACLGSGIVGGMVGQYVLQVTFSFILLSICGILYGQGELLKYRINRESR